MTFFEYLYFRMFKAYEAKNDSPYLRTFMYVTLVKFILSVVAFVYLRGILIKTEIITDIGKQETVTILSITGVLILLSTYLLYSRKRIDYYESKFERCELLNKRIKVWILIVSPFLFFFGGLFLYVILFGGEILGEPTKGLLN